MLRGSIGTTSSRHIASRTPTGGTGQADRLGARAAMDRLPARARILDAGCGSGRNMVELTAHGTVTGVELSSVSVEIARRRGVGDVLEGSILEMPFPAESFDLAVFLDVIEHLDDDLRATQGAAPRRRARRAPVRHRARLSVAVERARPRSTITIAATPAARCSPSRNRPAGNAHDRPTSTPSFCPSPSSCARSTPSAPRPPCPVLIRVPPRPANWLLERPAHTRGRRHRAWRAHTRRALPAHRLPVAPQPARSYT